MTSTIIYKPIPKNILDLLWKPSIIFNTTNLVLPLKP